MEIEQADMTLEELVAVKNRVQDYQRNPEGALRLSAKEASFILADNLKYSVWLQAEGDKLTVALALREDELCWNIGFTGTVSVEKGVATVVPSKLQIGALDFTPLALGKVYNFDRSDLDGPQAGRLLAQTQSLRIDDGWLEVKLDDPGSLR
jgi:hypothetical protein